MRTLYVAPLLFALAACPNREISRVDPNQDKEEFKDIPVQLNRDLDLIFMIDNSGSMAEEQDNLAANFPQFINVLQTIEGGLPNVHIAVISSDVGAGPFNISGCSGNGDNGDFRKGATDSCAQLGTANYIQDISDGAGGRTTNYTGTLADTFSCMATLGSNGCGFEQQLESLRRALNGNPNNAGFLRDSAFLGIVFVTDEDDCSTRDTQMFDTSQTDVSDPLGPLSSFRCNEFGVECETGNDDPRAPGPRTGCFPKEDSQYMYGVQEYVDFLYGLKSDPNLLVVAGIVAPTEPYAVGVDPERPQNPAIVPSCTVETGETCQQTSDCSNQKTCINGQCVSKADPPVRLQFLLDQFPQSASTTICNNNLSDGLQLIAELLKEAIGNPCLTSLLKDRNPSTPELDYECTVSDVFNPGTDEQTETLLPQCNAAEDLDPTDAPNSTNIPCWHLATDTTNCGDTPTQLTLVVERGDMSVPTGTHVQARCVTCNDLNENLVCDELEQ